MDFSHNSGFVVVSVKRSDLPFNLRGFSGQMCLKGRKEVKRADAACAPSRSEGSARHDASRRLPSQLLKASRKGKFLEGSNPPSGPKGLPSSPSLRAKPFFQSPSYTSHHPWSLHSTGYFALCFLYVLLLTAAVRNLPKT